MRKNYWLVLLGVTLLLAGGLWQQVAEAGGARNFGYMDTKSNRTYVPIRYLSEQLKYSVTWNKQAQQITVSQGQNKIVLTVGKKTAIWNNNTIQVDAAPFVREGVTYIPIRIMKDTMNLPLKWDTSGSTLLFQNGEQISKLPVISLERVMSSQPITKKQQTFSVGQKQIKAMILQIDLLSKDIQLGVAVANNKIGSVDSLKHMAAVNHAVAAMNGTYFDAYSNTGIQYPFGYIVQNGAVVNKNSDDNRSVLVFTKDNQVEIVSGNDFQTRLKEEQVYGALQAGPRLVTNGKVTVDPATEGFRDPKILTNSGARSAVGVTKDHKLILVTVPGAKVTELAKVMLQAGAYQAMGLDGGASSGLIYQGSYLITPGRELSNALLIYQSKS
ncbi:phosphodiester glycosidase family protein [Paenibacillus sp. J22TS3]|uniref:phosphodiester glycosidase family protein n=1 Tax=Paenibacillus sp. J22TS3 TaxID=2807192 RepID=UPI001B0D05AE|nr:phosphodiester glycosidase family protein [Paenibacillus sp. J22TS3]GIP22292.1 hypothetical protein J22TS3_25670 [Paenibacillus sp. J22TS3]